MNGLERTAARAGWRATRFTMSNFIAGLSAITMTFLIMVALAAVIGASYQLAAYGVVVDVTVPMVAGGAVALLYALTFLYRREYTIPAYLRGAHRPARIFMSWNAAFLGLFTVAFLTQTTMSVSRAMTLTFYAVGLLAMIATETGVRSMIIAGLRSGLLMPRRVMIVGGRTAAAEFVKRLSAAVTESERIGVRIVATADVGPDAEVGALANAVASARILLPDEIVIVARWEDTTLVDQVVAAFEQLPVAIHLDGGPVLARFSDLHLRRVGGVSTLSVAELPLTPAQVIAKRAFDIIGSSIGLVLLAPAFAVLVLLIRRETKGAAFFRQDRLGFNQAAFRIYKFRSMTTADDGPVIEQAKPGDPRITRIGQFLRRTSLDELPQLINVFKGEMSLVGPRPHAVAHDRDYEQRIRRYPRRLNIKPGITGWAQVNGYRGLTDTDEKMRQRVEADLYYIDNWSIMFDVYILLLTVLSPKTFKNAG
jgi:Undecaprenyl-phosphate glucose phosphotransferase